jgi:hypothetical protein
MLMHKPEVWHIKLFYNIIMTPRIAQVLKNFLRSKEYFWVPCNLLKEFYEQTLKVSWSIFIKN